MKVSDILIAAMLGLPVMAFSAERSVAVGGVTFDSEFQEKMREGKDQRADVLRKLQESEQDRAQGGSRGMNPLALPSPSPAASRERGAGLSPEQVADRYREMLLSEQVGSKDDDLAEIMVFVSFSMPEEALKRVVAEADRVGAIVVFRGLKHGLKRYAESVAALKIFDGPRTRLQIHPELFKTYDIRRVPALVLAPGMKAGCQDQACMAGAIVLSGDVSIEYALEHAAKRSDAAGTLARQKLQLLEAR